jgi:metal-responsive CopG/Arc/MetJ family transcriptional regulator
MAKMITVYFEDEVVASLEKMAMIEDRSRSRIIARACKKEIAEFEKSQQKEENK